MPCKPKLMHEEPYPGRDLPVVLERISTLHPESKCVCVGACVCVFVCLLVCLCVCEAPCRNWVAVLRSLLMLLPKVPLIAIWLKAQDTIEVQDLMCDCIHT